MEKQLLSEEKLNKLPKEAIVVLLLQQDKNLQQIFKQSAVIQI
jgi:hypothetical protein